MTSIIHDLWSINIDEDGSYNILDITGDPVCTGIRDFTTAECIAKTPELVGQSLSGVEPLLPHFVEAAVRRRSQM